MMHPIPAGITRPTEQLAAALAEAAVIEQHHSAVKRPKHYILLDTEAITLIASGLTQEQFYGYCLGNAMKYRLRAGKKDDTLQDIGKAEEYELLYEQHKHLCREGV